jgi:GT2 family glycosyltransferase
MRLFISVISHGHNDLIQKLDCLSKLAVPDWVELIVKDNLGEDKLKEYCLKNNIHYLVSSTMKGFGANNNEVFTYCLDKLAAEPSEKILLLNPDVVVNLNSIEKLLELTNMYGNKLFTIKLFKDKKLTKIDNSIRNYPSFSDFTLSLILGHKYNRSIIDIAKIKTPSKVDWCAGSFMLLSINRYKELNGFDEKYYMYCEDIDLCYRALHLHCTELIFIPDVFAIHLAQHQNRKVFSKHFFWHVKSSLRFLLSKYKYTQ